MIPQTEYDNYISKLLDTQTPQHGKLLRNQVEQMHSRGTSRPDDLKTVKDRVSRLEQKARDKLAENEKYEIFKKLYLNFIVY